MQVQRISNNNNLCSKGCSAVTINRINKKHADGKILLHTERTIHYYPYFDETNKQIATAINKLTRNLKNITSADEKGKIYIKFDSTSLVIHNKLRVTKKQAEEIVNKAGVETNDLLRIILAMQEVKVL